MKDIQSFLESSNKEKNPSLEESIVEKEISKAKEPKIFTRKKSNLKGLNREELMDLLKAEIKNRPNYSSYIFWVKEKILPNQPDIPPEELSQLLGISIAKALVILDQLRSDIEKK